MAGEFLRRVQQTIERYHMLRHGDNVLVAVSGGPDSIALLRALQLLKNYYRITLWAAHYNHRLRVDEADAAAEFVKIQTEKMGIALFLEVDDGSLAKQRGNLEEIARKKRYDFLERVASGIGARKIALGHTANDQAETFFLWLLRGTGTKGLGGMPPVRNNFFIRPLIEIEKKDILDFLKVEGVTWIEDSSNQKKSFTRNRIRHGLIPKLINEFDSRLIEKIAKTTEIVRDDDLYLEQLSFEKYVELRKEGKEKEVYFTIPELIALPVALQRRVLRHALREIKKTLRRISFAHMEALLALLHESSPHGSISFPDGISVYKEYEHLRIGYIFVKKVSFHHEFNFLPNEIAIPEINRTITINLLEWNQGSPPLSNNNAALIDFDTLRLPLIVRNWKAGDRFQPLGTQGFKKVKDFFIDCKLPKRERIEIPLILFGDSISWIGGQRIDDRVKITDSTKKVIRMELH
ncbi:MAG: tRNA lysidine(34) synthetase TilS [Pseudomonadota bacterium]